MNFFCPTSPFKLDISQEFSELKKGFTCKVCEGIMTNPVTLNTCNHTLCTSCLDAKKLTCPICRSPYNEIDIKTDNFTESVIKSIWKIQSICNKKVQDTSLNSIGDIDINYEMCVTRYAMKRNPKGETPLHVACKKGNISTVTTLIQSGVDVNITDWANWAPIHEAIERNHYNCVELLLRNGALINIAGAYYTTPLHKAVSCNADDIIKLLLKHNADKTIIDFAGQTPLNYVTDKKKINLFLNIKPETTYVPKVYFGKDIVLYAEEFTKQLVTNLVKHGVRIINKQEFRKKDEATHFVMPDVNIKTRTFDINFLFAIVKGIFVINEKWSHQLPLKVIAYEYIVEDYQNVIKTSIENRLKRNPKLFDGINFRILDHDEAVKINSLNMNKIDLSLLIEAGGGKILYRAPALRTVSKDIFYPFHAKESETLKECCNYIIFNEDKRPELIYNMKELQHKSSKWLINCILNFKIID